MERPVPDVTRERTVAELGERAFDLLVIGGGIIGAGIAAQATRAGLAVALVERGDFGGGTSSASSKLVHGGLRYLRLGDVGLVREAHYERRALSNVVAPHLVRRTPFLLPLYRGGPFTPAFVQSGILVYSTLALSRLNWLVRPERARGLVPSLRTAGLRSCALYADAWTNDARLCLANVVAAARAGATVANDAEVTGLEQAGGRVVAARVTLDGEQVLVRARSVVNASGPWVDHVRRLEDPAAVSSVRLSKGVHVLLSCDERWEAALTIPQDDVRVSFAVPWYGMLLLGTTDTPHDGDPGAVAVEPRDVEDVLREAAVALGPEFTARDRVRATFAGLRVLPAGPGESASARRETVFSVGPAGMLSVAGGKLTTYRRIALEALRRLRADLGLHRLDPRPWPLPDATHDAEPLLPVAVPPALRDHLVHLYGSRAGDVLAGALEDPTLLEPLHDDGPDIVAQARYAYRSEWARTPDDVLRRRTTVAWRGLDDETARERAASAAPSPLEPRAAG
ncbi:MAG: glycerol-3-phosphate dehydrogenase/oxidase [Gaiellaceae bacterium]